MKKTILALTILAACGTAHADVRINGFANLIAGKTSSDDMLYGYDEDISLSPESLFAVQLSGDVNDKMTATGQLVARGSDDYDVDFEWAYFSYAATDNLSVSAGRLRLPLFRYSASLDVGYSYHWVVAPDSVYGVPFNNIDGVRIDYSGYTGDWEYVVQLMAGTVENDVTVSGAPASLDIKNTLGTSIELSYSNWKFRGSLLRGDVTLESDALTPAIGQLSQISQALSSLLAVDDDTGVFAGVGIEYDNFNWFIASEYTLVTIDDSFYPDEKNYYVTAGARFGKWTPFVTYESADLNDDVKFLSRLGSLPAELRGPAGQLIGGIQQAVMSESKTVSAGVRYDFDTNVAIKADINRRTDEIYENNDATLVRVGVNYIF